MDLTYHGVETYTRDGPDLSSGDWRPITALSNVENLTGTAFDDKLRGDAGDNSFFYTDGFDIYNGRGGVDTVDFSTFGSAIWVDLTYRGPEVYTRDGPDLSSGAWRPLADLSSIETIVGTAFDDLLRGDAGNNTLYGGRGTDKLTGRDGDDIYVFVDGDGSDTITGFAAGAGSDDAIDLSMHSGADSFADIQGLAEQDGADTVIDLGDSDVLTLTNVTATDLHPDDFLF